MDYVWVDPCIVQYSECHNRPNLLLEHQQQQLNASGARQRHIAELEPHVRPAINADTSRIRNACVPPAGEQLLLGLALLIGLDDEILQLRMTGLPPTA